MEVRREVLAFGSLPFAAAIPHADTTDTVSPLLQIYVKLLEAGVKHNTSWFVSTEKLAAVLEIPDNFAKVLVDTVALVAPPGQAVVKDSCVDVHAVVLYLFAQLYTRQASRPDSKDIWPTGSGPEPPWTLQLEPSSPVRMSNKNLSAPWPSNVVRQQLQQHQVHQQALVGGFAEFVQRHSVDILLLCLDAPCLQQDDLPSRTVRVHEFNRLQYLLEATPAGTEALQQIQGPLQSPDGAPLLTLSAWLTLQVRDSGALRNVIQASDRAAHPGSSSSAGSPSSSPLLQSSSSIGGQGCDEISGIVRNTVVRGFGSFPRGQCRIADCHDATVYALAPLELVCVSCCSDCTVIVGAVGKLLRVERCVRLQLIAACKRIYINASHDCIFYLGATEAPVLLGDNRFVQFAPHNTWYDRLPQHMEAVGLGTSPNLWNQPIVLLTDPSSTASHVDLLRSPDAKSPELRSKPPPTFSILPPDKLMPFTVPFKGGQGKLCGGPANLAALTRSDSIGASYSRPGGISTMFPLPPEYEVAVNKKIDSVTQLRMAVKNANLPDEKKKEVQHVIQSYFREWLNSTGRMRQIYDLARMEKEETARAAAEKGADQAVPM